MPPGYISNTVGDEFWPSFGRALATPLSCLSIAMWAHRSWLHNLLEKKMGKGRRKAAGNPRHLTCNDRPHSPWQATNGQNLSSNLNGILLSSPKTSTSLLLRRFSLFFQFFFFWLHMQPENGLGLRVFGVARAWIMVFLPFFATPNALIYI